VVTPQSSTLSRRSEGATTPKARLLLERGADPNSRASLRKQLRGADDPEKERMVEFHNVTPIGYGRLFQEPSWISQPALDLLAQYGGSE
jgi:hypothetical protein